MESTIHIRLCNVHGGEMEAVGKSWAICNFLFVDVMKGNEAFYYV